MLLILGVWRKHVKCSFYTPKTSYCLLVMYYIGEQEISHFCSMILSHLCDSFLIWRPYIFRFFTVKCWTKCHFRSHHEWDLSFSCKLKNKWWADSDRSTSGGCNVTSQPRSENFLRVTKSVWGFWHLSILVVLLICFIIE